MCFLHVREQVGTQATEKAISKTSGEIYCGSVLSALSGEAKEFHALGIGHELG